MSYYLEKLTCIGSIVQNVSIRAIYVQREKLVMEGEKWLHYILVSPTKNIECFYEVPTWFGPKMKKVAKLHDNFAKLQKLS